MKHHEHFMQIALDEAGIALDANEFPVGCVLVFRDEVIAKGRRTNSLVKTVNELDHAEITALRNLGENHVDTDRSEIIAYTTMEPCLMCYSALLLNGIRTIVYGYEDAMGGGTSLPLGLLNPLYSQMKVLLIPHVLRDKSLELFKKFFSNPENKYRKESLLAEYTLAQP